jgi:hypothetical protein
MDPVLDVEFGEVATCRPSAGMLLVGIDTGGLAHPESRVGFDEFDSELGSGEVQEDRRKTAHTK